MKAVTPVGLGSARRGDRRSNGSAEQNEGPGNGAGAAALDVLPRAPPFSGGTGTVVRVKLPFPPPLASSRSLSAPRRTRGTSPPSPAPRRRPPTAGRSPPRPAECATASVVSGLFAGGGRNPYRRAARQGPGAQVRRGLLSATVEHDCRADRGEDLGILRPNRSVPAAHLSLDVQLRKFTGALVLAALVVDGVAATPAVPVGGVPAAAAGLRPSRAATRSRATVERASGHPAPAFLPTKTGAGCLGAGGMS